MSEDKMVLLKQRELYGVVKFYPFNETAKTFCAIAKQTTMTDATIELVKKLGYTVKTDRINLEE